MWKAVEDKVNKARMAEVKGGKNVKGKKERVQETNSWERNRDSKDGRRKAKEGRRLDRY